MRIEEGWRINCEGLREMREGGWRRKEGGKGRGGGGEREREDEWDSARMGLPLP